jgi:hypothetical protein
MVRERFVSTFAIAFAVGSLTAGAAWAGQDRTSNGNTTGTSAPRGGDSGSSSTSSGSSSSGSSSSSSGSSVGSSPSAAAPWNTFEAPRRSGEQSPGGRSAGGNPTSGRATPRGGSDSSPRGGGETASTSGDRSSSGDEPRRAVPAYSRPRDGRPVTGVAVERGTVLPPTGGTVIYSPYYPWGFWGPGYGYGLGYLFYDPWYGGGYGWGDPYGYGYGGYGYGGGGGGGGYAVSQSYRDSGSLRLKIDPKQAQVYIDGYYVGIVDNFDGAFQKLSLDSGGHRVELKAEGFEPISFEVLITPGETVTYKGELKRGK